MQLIKLYVLIYVPIVQCYSNSGGGGLQGARYNARSLYAFFDFCVGNRHQIVARSQMKAVETVMLTQFS